MFENYLRTHRRQFIVGVAVVLVMLTGVGIALAVQKNQGATTDPPQADTTEETIEPASSDATGLDEDEGHDVEKVEPPIINQEPISNADVQQKTIPAARAAASQYLQQSKSETRIQRQERLKTVFHPESLAIYDEPPAVDPTYSPNTSSTPTILSTTWVAKESYIIVTVAMKITTTDNNPPHTVISEIYQAWDVKVRPTPDQHFAETISYNNSPIVITEDQ